MFLKHYVSYVENPWSWNKSSMPVGVCSSQPRWPSLEPKGCFSCSPISTKDPTGKKSPSVVKEPRREKASPSSWCVRALAFWSRKSANASCWTPAPRRGGNCSQRKEVSSRSHVKGITVIWMLNIIGGGELFGSCFFSSSFMFRFWKVLRDPEREKLSRRIRIRLCYRVWFPAPH